MPQFSNAQQGARPAYYDRQPALTGSAYQALLAGPHALTNRTSYTGPAARKSWLDSIWLHISRTAAAGPADQAQLIVQYTPAGGSVYMLACAWLFNNAVGAIHDLVIPVGGYIGPGDLLQVQTIDGSTGGLCNYRYAVKITEFVP